MKGNVVSKVARIVFLNGVGSVGKTSLAKALQAITQEPFLYVPMDAFLDMLPEKYFDHPDGFVFETTQVDGKPSVVIKTGLVGERTLSGMRHAIVALAAQGNDLIIDEVLLGAEKAEYRQLLAPFEVHWVGVFAPLDVLEERERRRGDRLIGLSRWQYDKVHRDMTYDLEIDTSHETPLACAERIKQTFGL